MGAPKYSPAVEAAIASNNMLFSYYILIILGAIVVSIAIYRVIIHSIRYIRTLTCLNGNRQQYFKLPNTLHGWFKQHLLYAPLFNRRHNKQMRIGPIEMGILPSRFQSLPLSRHNLLTVINKHDIFTPSKEENPPRPRSSTNKRKSFSTHPTPKSQL